MTLTPRQRQVVQLLADGLSCPQIARRLAISPRTVHAHIRTIATRLSGNGGALRRILLHAEKLLAA